jgi:lipopolysaccharide biosynthesis glycosyltransferase
LNITINILNQTIQDQNITKLNQTVQDLIQEVDGMSGDIADLKNQIKDIVILQNQINELKKSSKRIRNITCKNNRPTEPNK